jgi:glycosyltransferase involved in cell wall biosynthesis
MREKRSGNYSIEQIFEAIRDELVQKIDIKVFQQNKTFDIKAIIFAKSRAGDINHITGDCNLLIYGLIFSKTILTIHDIGHYELSLKGIKKAIYGYLWFKLPFKFATKITTISEFTKEKLISRFGVNPSKIDLIYNPVSPLFFFHIKHFNIENPIILQIGSSKNKNVERLIEAVEGLSCSLCLVRNNDEKLINLLNEKKIKYTWHCNVDKKSLVELYIQADIVYFASTYEGFGMPIIEAQAIGRPVITSNIQPMIDVSGNAALLVNPLDVFSIRQAIKSLIKNRNLMISLVEKGKLNVQKYSISAIANQYLTIYKSL